MVTWGSPHDFGSRQAPQGALDIRGCYARQQQSFEFTVHVRGDTHSPLDGIGGFPKWGYPEMDGLYGKTLVKWMIFGGTPIFQEMPN